WASRTLTPSVLIDGAQHPSEMLSHEGVRPAAPRRLPSSPPPRPTNTSADRPAACPPRAQNAANVVLQRCKERRCLARKLLQRFNGGRDARPNGVATLRQRS